MRDRDTLPEAQFRIRWARESGKFEILTKAGDLIETVDRETMMPLMLNKHAHADYLAKHGIAGEETGYAAAPR